MNLYSSYVHSCGANYGSLIALSPSISTSECSSAYLYVHCLVSSATSAISMPGLLGLDLYCGDGCCFMLVMIVSCTSIKAVGILRGGYSSIAGIKSNLSSAGSFAAIT